MELFLLWIALSVIVGYFWRSKGLSFGVGVLLSILLSAPIGFVIGLVREADPKQQEADKLASGTQRKCPFCAEIIKTEAKVCRFCGRDVPAPPPVTPNQTIAERVLPPDAHWSARVDGRFK